MTLALSRVDYVSVGVTSRGTTRILPPTDPKQTQKFVVGDHDGILQVFGKQSNLFNFFSFFSIILNNPYL